MTVVRAGLFLWGVFWVSGSLHAEDHAQFFRDQVEPLLNKRCYDCHSHGSGQMEGGLTLDWRTGWETGGGRGPAIVPGSPEQSLLIRAIQHADPDLQMPEERLPEEEIAILTRWIAEGAYDDRTAEPDDEQADQNVRDWWSLKPLVRPAVPAASGQNEIDAFIHARLRSAGLAPAPRADRRTLIRRLSYDLTGLPPTPQAVDTFVADRDPLAYEKLVDRLLNSPRYGERWARHWLDSIHFADSHGFEHDVGRDHAWRFRDYVIRALNSDTPWQRLIREQLAADHFFPDRPELTAALGFLGAGPFDLSAYGTAPISFAYLDRDDLVTQTMGHFASVTVHCARCHDHKFDPISQEDYYALQAVFAGVVKGDIRYDQNASVAAQRQRWQTLITAADSGNADVLLAGQNAELVDAWLASRPNSPQWQPLEVEAFVSAEGTTLTRTAEGTFLASGTSPERDTYTLTATSTLKGITGVRLDVLSHDSLPMGGPGRCHNGNLHLSEIEFRVFEPGAQQGHTVAIRGATADFNQAGWGIQRAIDGDAATAWGIHPAVGQPHYAVFEFAEPLTLDSKDRLALVLRQAHGGQHTIGAFDVSVTVNPRPSDAAAPADVAMAIATAAEHRTADQKLKLAAYALRSVAEQRLRALPPQQIIYAAGSSVSFPASEGQTPQVVALTEPKAVHVLRRGAFDSPGEVAQPGALSILTHLPSRIALQDSHNEAQRRAALADWLAHPENVLTWRSAINRVWHNHFGRGLCDTLDDFGRMGGQPSHPELLDWLAVWFRDDASGSLKKLHRLIVTSESYRQSSQFREGPAKLDTENRLLWRQNRHRLDAEGVRDFVLAASGSLELTMGGPGIQHFTQSKGIQLTPELNYTAYDWRSPGSGRRSIYRFVWRGIPDPFMEVFDFPDLGLLAPVRGSSSSSLQSLALYNNDFMLHHSHALAERAKREADTLPSQVRRIVRLLWCRQSTAEEEREFTEFARQQGLAPLCRVLLNSNEFLFVD